MLNAREMDIANMEIELYLTELMAELDAEWLGERGEYADLYGETGRELGEPGGEIESPAPELAEPQPGY